MCTQDKNGKENSKAEQRLKQAAQANAAASASHAVTSLLQKMIKKEAQTLDSKGVVPGFNTRKIAPGSVRTG